MSPFESHDQFAVYRIPTETCSIQVCKIVVIEKQDFIRLCSQMNGPLRSLGAGHK